MNKAAHKCSKTDCISDWISNAKNATSVWKIARENGFFFANNKFSFRAPCVYQDRRFKFIPVALAVVACTAGAHCSASSEVQLGAIY